MEKVEEIYKATFLSRDTNFINIKIQGQEEQYSIVKIYEFSSDRKMMSITVKEEKTGKFFNFAKGADMMIKSKLHSIGRKEQAQFQNLESYANQGLRTLMFAMRELEDGHTDFGDVECGYKLLGVTAVEDLLQDNVAKCIQDFMQANIKVWMLTGDKGATAQQIGKTCGIFDRDMQVFEFSERGDAGVELIRLTNLLKLKHMSGAAFLEQQDASKVPMLRDSDGDSTDEVAASVGKLQMESRAWSTSVSANAEDRKLDLKGLLICGASLPSIFRSEANAHSFSQILSHMRSIIVYRSSPS